MSLRSNLKCHLTPRIAAALAASLLMILSAGYSQDQSTNRAKDQIKDQIKDQSKSSDADAAAIKQVFAKFDANFNRHDAHDTGVFSEDVDFTNMRGAHRRGRNEIDQWLTPLMAGAGTLSAAHRTDTVRSIRYLTPQIAAVDADSVITGSKAPDGSEVPPRKGLMIAVLSKNNGQWQISIFHEAEYPPAPAATPGK